MPEQLELPLLTWETKVSKLPDGSVVLTPRRPRPAPEWLDRHDVERLTGLKCSQAVKLMHELGAQQRAPRCRLRVPAEALTKLLQRRAA